MKIQPAVREQTKAVAVGVCILTALMVGVFLVIGKFDWTVLTGALLGASAGIANFFLMALTVQGRTRSRRRKKRTRPNRRRSGPRKQPR